MTTVSLEEAESRLADLLDKAATGEPFLIARPGKPLIQVVAVPTPPAKPTNRLGFMKTQFKVPDDFDSMHAEEILAMFEGDAPQRQEFSE